MEEELTPKNMEEKEKIDAWAEESMGILREYGYLKNHRNLWLLLVFILGMSFLALGYYAGDNEWFKSNINQTVTLEPNISTFNDYSFETPIQNDYKFSPNYTIINNIVCP